MEVWTVFFTVVQVIVCELCAVILYTTSLDEDEEEEDEEEVEMDTKEICALVA
jgi:hypothetical protein